jgi:signal transduction histidine kinase
VSSNLLSRLFGAILLLLVLEAVIAGIVNQFLAGGWSVLVALAITVPIAAWVAHRVTARLRRVAAFARQIAEGNLAARLPRNLSGDDLSVMESALNQTAERLHASFAESESRGQELAAILDSMQEAVFAVTPEGAVRWSNAVMQQIANTQIRTGRPLVHSVRDPEVLNCLRGTLAGHEVRNGRSSSLAPGRVFEISTIPLSDGGALVVLRDVTSIEAAERSRREFIANVSHELRTPITTILTSCELLATERTISERARVRIGMIEAAATRMGEQLQALLFLAREQALGIMEPVALAECVYEAVEPVCSEIYRKRLNFEVAIEPKAILTLNRQALHTALVNLLRNAVQYTERGFIRVNFSQSRLSISDSGIGIEPFYMPLLYERFFRGSTQGEGLGIGLAIVKRICDHYGWIIDVESTPGKGATFHITFPASQAVALTNSSQFL